MDLRMGRQKKGFVLLLALVAIMMLLASCGGGEKGGNSGDPASPSSESAAEGNESTDAETDGENAMDTEEAAKEETRTVTDDLGREVEIPVEPQRIVAGEFAAELLTLGIKPIASGDNGFKVIYTLEEMEGVERIGDPPNPEILLDLNPDLVVAPTVFLEIYPEQMEQIAKLAPVYYLTFDQDPIYGIFAKLAELVGRSDQAKVWIAEYEQEAELARIQLKDAIGDESVSIFRIEKGRLRIYLNRNFAGYMVRSSLKLPAPEAVADEIEKNPNSSAVQISLEMLPQFAGDHLFIIVRDEGDDRAEFEEIQKSGLWSNLDAVKNGNIHFLETEKYYGSDIVTIRETMKEAVQMLSPESAKRGD